MARFSFAVWVFEQGVFFFSLVRASCVETIGFQEVGWSCIIFRSLSLVEGLEEIPDPTCSGSTMGGTGNLEKRFVCGR